MKTCNTQNHFNLHLTCSQKVYLFYVAYIMPPCLFFLPSAHKCHIRCRNAMQCIECDGRKEKINVFDVTIIITLIIKRIIIIVEQAHYMRMRTIIISLCIWRFSVVAAHINTHARIFFLLIFQIYYSKHVLCSKIGSSLQQLDIIIHNNKNNDNIKIYMYLSSSSSSLLAQLFKCDINLNSTYESGQISRA